MSRFIKTRGFTLIELMVVIVIIGVLASLAIPRFSEASDKAKVAEAPRILVSFESAYLAGKAELGDSVKSMDDIIFDSAALSSRWFAYSSQNSDGLLRGFQGATKSVIGKINIGDAFSTRDSTNGGIFAHCFSGTYATGKKYVPNFLTGTANPATCASN